jgi:hypothetical protein
VLRFNSTSRFFDAFKELEMESRIRPYLHNYADFEFDLDYEKSEVSFSRGEITHIKVSRGEENIFIWCVFLALAEAAIDAQPGQAYDWGELPVHRRPDFIAGRQQCHCGGQRSGQAAATRQG